jgi:hypothetical protein
MTDRRCHPPNLTILSLGQRELQPTIRHGLAHPNRHPSVWEFGWLVEQLDFGGPSAAVLQVETNTKLAQRLGRRNTLNLNEIAPGVPDIGPHELSAKVFASGQKKKALAIAVESAGRVDVGHIDVVGQRLPTVAIGERRHHPVRLPEPQEKIVVGQKYQGNADQSGERFSRKASRPSIASSVM